jgi:hypothetical protein
MNAWQNNTLNCITIIWSVNKQFKILRETIILALITIHKIHILIIKFLLFFNMKQRINNLIKDLLIMLLKINFYLITCKNLIKTINKMNLQCIKNKEKSMILAFEERKRILKNRIKNQIKFSCLIYSKFQ